MKRLYVVLLASALFACKNQPAENAATTPETTAEKTTEPVPPPIPSDVDISKFDGNFLVFWNEFKKHVGLENKVYVLSMMHFPLHGGSYFASRGLPEVMTGDNMRYEYFRIFDNFTLETIKEATLASIKINTVGENDPADMPAEALGLAQGTTYYSLPVLRIDNSSTESQSGTVTLLNFAKINGKYLLAWFSKA